MKLSYFRVFVISTLFFSISCNYEEFDNKRMNNFGGSKRIVKVNDFSSEKFKKNKTSIKNNNIFNKNINNNSKKEKNQLNTKKINKYEYKDDIQENDNINEEKTILETIYLSNNNISNNGITCYNNIESLSNNECFSIYNCVCSNYYNNEKNNYYLKYIEKGILHPYIYLSVLEKTQSYKFEVINPILINIEKEKSMIFDYRLLKKIIAKCFILNNKLILKNLIFNLKNAKNDYYNKSLLFSFIHNLSLNDLVEGAAITQEVLNMIKSYPPYIKNINIAENYNLMLDEIIKNNLKKLYSHKFFKINDCDNNKNKNSTLYTIEFIINELIRGFYNHNNRLNKKPIETNILSIYLDNVNLNPLNNLNIWSWLYSNKNNFNYGLTFTPTKQFIDANKKIIEIIEKTRNSFFLYDIIENSITIGNIKDICDTKKNINNNNKFDIIEQSEELCNIDDDNNCIKMINRPIIYDCFLRDLFYYLNYLLKRIKKDNRKKNKLKYKSKQLIDQKIDIGEFLIIKNKRFYYIDYINIFALYLLIKYELS